jgi:uncharacterized protein YgiM (DUF1202 family)
VPAFFFTLIITIFTESRCLEAASPIYVVAAANALLRDNPSPDSAILTQLQRSDQVEFLDNNGYGWWKVRSLRTGVIGWMTADLLKALPPASGQSAAVGPGYYYVNTSTMDLHSLPLYSSPVTGSVKFNDRVEKLGDSPGGWTKIRNPKDSRAGWLPSRYLSAKVAACPQPVAQAPRKRIKRALPIKKKPKIEKKAPEEERPEPM